ncbi:MAG TPA: RNA polymerase sigma factor [Polyangiaceae bacterium]|nr:RNA polymerase sigma factor [Polyangiaceae bacterium]
MKPGSRRNAPVRDVGDADLIRAIAGGDVAALGELYDRYAGAVWRAARRTLANPADAEDIVHATFLGLSRIAPSYDGRASCRNWLCGIAVHLSLRHRRGAGRLRRVLGAFAQTLTGRSVGEREVEDRAIGQEHLALIERALAGLSEKKRAVFVLVELEGLSPEEAARSLGIPPATARTRLFHARRELQVALRMEGV